MPVHRSHSRTDRLWRRRTAFQALCFGGTLGLPAVVEQALTEHATSPCALVFTAVPPRQGSPEIPVAAAGSGPGSPRRPVPPTLAGSSASAHLTYRKSPGSRLGRYRQDFTLRAVRKGEK